MKTLISLLLLILPLVPKAYADEKILRQMSLSGRSTIVDLTSDLKSVTLWTISSGNMSSYLALGLTIPAGTRIKLSAARLIGSVEDTLQDTSVFFKLPLLTDDESRAKHSECLEIGGGSSTSDLIDVADFPPMESPLCDLFSAAEKETLAAQMSATFGGAWSNGNVCSFLVTVSMKPDLGGKSQWCALYDWNTLLLLGVDCFPHGLFALQTGAPVSEQYTALFRKDACVKAAASKYLIKLQISLPQDFNVEVPLTVRINEYKRKKGKPAALKPESDGRYAPQPIFLMNYLGRNCGNIINVVKWQKNKPKAISEIKPYGLLYYNEFVFALGLASGKLTGGQGTVELNDSQNAYGVCFDLVKRRQNKNGYPR